MLNEQYRTQKTKSVKVMQGLYHKFPSALGLASPTVYGVWPHDISSTYTFPLFARPAPTTPQHGFVDSRVVHSYEELFRLTALANRADPLAEVILMPEIKGDFSAIATNGQIAIGQGNDGATGGKSVATIRTPVANMTFEGKPHHTHFSEFFDPWHRAGVTHGYLELVHDRTRDTMVAVQFRDGPEQPRTKDFIPREMTITTVEICALDFDLATEWPARVKELQASDSPVVWLRNGSLASHHAIHAIMAGIAVVTSGTPPRVGDQLFPAEDAIMPMTDEDAQHIAEMMAEFEDTRLGSFDAEIDRSSFAALAHGVVHSQHLWNGSEHHRLRAYGIAALFPLGALAVFGEYRHFGQFDEDGESTANGRSSVLVRHATESDERLLSQLEAIGDDFTAEGYWGGGTGYGGASWEEFKDTLIDFYTTLAAFKQERTAESWQALMNHANELVHLSHNNGRVYNKFTKPDEISKTPVLGFVNIVAARLAWRDFEEAQGAQHLEPAKPAFVPAPPGKGSYVVDLSSLDFAEVEIKTLAYTQDPFREHLSK